MKTKLAETSSHVRGVLCAVTTLVLVLTGALPASAGWRAVDAQNSWADFQRAFQYTGAASYEYDFSKGVGDGVQQDFWREAELIELAVDAYEENKTAANKQEVQGLCDGFIGLYGEDWSGDTFNDDMCWACLAFVRAYIATGTTRYLNDAESNFNEIWTRGEDPSDGGIWWTTAKTKKASASNWPFVIAGHLIYNESGSTAALNRANVVYGFCKAHLCDSGTGQVYDSYSSGGTDTFPWSYNYGVAVGAASESGDGGFAANAAWWLMTSLPINYYATQIGGYYVLPRYNHNEDDSGFNGIVFRWFHTADSHGLIDHNYYVAWAQTNISQAWAERNAEGLSWNDWITQTPDSSSGNVYSWDVSDTLSGMLNVPPTN
jgi:predicted alpha-1,6-mannanase (GH76 family)